MAKFGRFEFKAESPAEVYEGDFMALERGYVRIFEGESGDIIPSLIPPRLIAAIHLDSGQSVREIKAESKGEKPTKSAEKLKPLRIAQGREFR